MAGSIARILRAPFRIARLPRSRAPSIPQHEQDKARQRGSAAAHALGFPLRSLGAVQRPQARGTRRPRAHCACRARCASTVYLRGGWEDPAERGAVGAAATAAERGAQAVVAERRRVARGLRAGALARLSSLALPADGCSSTCVRPRVSLEGLYQNGRNQGPGKIVGPGFRPSTSKCVKGGLVCEVWSL